MENNNIRYSLATDGILDLEDLWTDAIETYGTKPKGEIFPNHNKQTEENKMERIKNKKSLILVAVYAFLIIVELFLYVPYHNIQLFVSRENVPHTEIIGSGYATMTNITNDNAYVKDRLSSATGKRVNTSQLLANVSITTVLAIAIYFLLLKNEKKIVEENIPIPFLDINALAFATEDQIIQAQQDYARKMAEYVRKKI